MIKIWSFNTTLRNPDRVVDFFNVLSKFEGEEWNEKTQTQYFLEQIQQRIYKPTKLTDVENSKYQEDGYLFSDDELYKMASRSNKELGIRGRQPMSACKRLGLVSVENKKLKLSELGNLYTKNQITERELFVNFIFKLQGPIPNNPTFNEKNGFNIKFFPALIRLINTVNTEMKNNGLNPYGITRTELDIFGTSLTNHEVLDSAVNNLLDFRKNIESIKNKKEHNFDIKYLNNYKLAYSKLPKDASIDKQRKTIDNFKEYGDSLFRYLLKTGFVRSRGFRMVDISESFLPQAKLLDESNEVKPIIFNSEKEYFEYLTDLNSYKPPWTEENTIKQLEEDLIQYFKESTGKEINLEKKVELESKFNISSETEVVTTIRQALIKNKQDEMAKEVNDSSYLRDIISKRFTEMAKREKGKINDIPVELKYELEYRSFQAILSINDALSVDPTYKSSEDLIPTGFAPGRPDLTSDYEKFGLVTEVTMMTGQQQWHHESGAILDHYFEFCKNNSERTNYLLFLAPKIHERTFNTLWGHSNFGFDNSKELGIELKIVPLSMFQWSDVLNYFVEIKENNKKDDSQLLMNLLEELVCNQNESKPEWKERLSKIVSELV